MRSTAEEYAAGEALERYFAIEPAAPSPIGWQLERALLGLAHKEPPSGRNSSESAMLRRCGAGAGGRLLRGCSPQQRAALKLHYFERFFAGVFDRQIGEDRNGRAIREPMGVATSLDEKRCARLMGVGRREYRRLLTAGRAQVVSNLRAMRRRR